MEDADRPPRQSRAVRNALLGITFLPAQGAFLAPAFEDSSNTLAWIVWAVVLVACITVVWIVTRQDRADGISAPPRWWPALTIPAFMVAGILLLALGIRI